MRATLCRDSGLPSSANGSSQTGVSVAVTSRPCLRTPRSPVCVCTQRPAAILALVPFALPSHFVNRVLECPPLQIHQGLIYQTVNVGPSESRTLPDLASRLGGWFFRQTCLARRGTTGEFSWVMLWLCVASWCRGRVLLCKVVPASVPRPPKS